MPRKKTNEEFLNEVYNLVQDEYTFLEEYKSGHSKMEVIHNECETKYYVSPANFLSGYRCKKCQMKIVHDSQRRSVDEILEIINNDCFEFVEFPNDYINCQSKITVKCKNGHTSTKSIQCAINHKGCPKCKSSKGENRIKDFLVNNNIIFEEQYWFKDCRNINPLPFDFAIFEEGNIKLLIEYDGEQHYKPYRTENGEEKLRKIQKNDNIKNEYCNNNDIDLLRIPYWDFNIIEDILKTSIINKTL